MMNTCLEERTVHSRSGERAFLCRQRTFRPFFSFTPHCRGACGLREWLAQPCSRELPGALDRFSAISFRWRRLFAHPWTREEKFWRIELRFHPISYEADLSRPQNPNPVLKKVDKKPLFSKVSSRRWQIQCSQLFAPHIRFWGNWNYGRIGCKVDI